MPSRRAFLSTSLALAAGPLLAGCAASVSAEPAASEDQPLVMIVRHAEKPTGKGAPYGIDPNGGQDDKSLTTRGWTRAGALVGLLDPVSTDGPRALRPGLARPVALIAAAPEGASKRPFQTLTPLGARLAITIDTSLRKGDEAALASTLRASSAPTLVAWEHEAIPRIVSALGTVTPTPPTSWPDDRFDLVWCFTRAGDASWTFAQIPQLLLDGDSEQGA